MVAVKFAEVEVYCPFVLGDKISDGDIVRTITDIVCSRYLKNSRIEIMYELDNSGELVYIIPKIERRNDSCGQ